MPIMRWDPFTALARLDDEFDDLVRRTFGAGTYQYVPAVEMATDGSDVIITLELPGVDVEDIDIEVADGRLIITGERKDHWGDTRGKVLVRELRYGGFRRIFQLPDGVSANQVEADVDKGLLHIRVKNVTKPVESPRKIAVKPSTEPKTIEGKSSPSVSSPSVSGSGVSVSGSGVSVSGSGVSGSGSGVSRSGVSGASGQNPSGPRVEGRTGDVTA
jgi:HSP20 family protein